MKKLFLGKVLLFLATVLFFSNCNNCENGDVRPLSFLVQNKDGKDFLNKNTKGYFVKDSIVLTDEKKVKIAFTIDSLTTPLTTSKKIVQFHLTPQISLSEGTARYFVKWKSSDVDTLDVVVEFIGKCKNANIKKVTFNKVDCNIDKDAYAWPYVIVK
jgi:hypothetical protein